MRTFDVEISGITSLLQHRFSEAAEVDGAAATRTVNLATETPRDAAERVAYRNEDGSLYHPGAAISRLLREAGSSHKQKGSRKSLKYIVPAAVIVVDDALPLSNGKPLTDFEVDSRPVTIPATKGRIMRHRPRLDEWNIKFRVEVDETVLPPDIIHQLLVEGGQRIGIGDYRPEKGGPFGRFQVLCWDEVTEDE
jgi:hypothetical protein